MKECATLSHGVHCSVFLLPERAKYVLPVVNHAMEHPEMKFATLEYEAFSIVSITC